MDSSVFLHAIDVWSNANFTSIQKSLDESILKVKELETKSLESRKSLATETKRFKRLEEQEKLGQINKIIKQYQHEVDSLTSRSKFSEDAMLGIYAKLSEAPDPTPLLQASIDEVKDQAEVSKLQNTISELENKIAKHADYDKIRARLLDLEQNSAKTLSKRLLAKEQELNSTWQEKERNWLEREKELARQLDTLKSSNKVLESKLSMTEDERGAVTSEHSSAEHDLILQELEASQVRIMDLEKRNEELNGSLALATSDAAQESQIHSKDMKINQLESENALLSASLERERVSLNSEITEKTRQLATLKKQLDSSAGELDTVRRKLNNYADYDTIKSELVALKKIEFGASDDEGDDVSSTLRAANKKLQSNLAELRAKSKDLEKENSVMQKEVLSLKGEVTKLQNLNTKLELDLEKVEDVGQLADTVSLMSGATRQMNRVGPTGRHGGRLSPTSSIVGIPEEYEPSFPNGNSTILPIVTQQRDRFRNRNMELEKQARQLSLDQVNLKSEIKKLKADNSKLYERIRYLSSYSSSQQVMDDAEAQYSRSYEESLHPLADFKQRELSQYRNKRMSPLERLFLSFAKIILANKTSRMLFMFYCVGLHGLVMVMCLYVASFSGYVTSDVGVMQTAEASGAGSKLGNVPI